MAIVLLVEDLPEEQARAKAAFAAHDFRGAVAETLEDALRIWKGLGDKLCGIITDLHFPEGGSGGKRDASKPCGLAIVAEATRQGLPVVVCSDVDHHFAHYLEVVISVLGDFHPRGRIPFIMDRKDWDRAAEQLRKLIGEEVR